MTLPYFVIIPLIAAFVITLIAGKKDVWGRVLALLSSAALLALALVEFFQLNGRTLIYEMGNWRLPFGIRSPPKGQDVRRRSQSRLHLCWLSNEAFRHAPRPI